MKVNITRVLFFSILFFVLISGFSLLLFLTFYHPGEGSYIQDLSQNGIAYGKQVSVVVINLREDGALDTENSLRRGELYLLMEILDNKTRVFFNDLNSLQQLDEYQQGMLSANNAVYKNLEVGQFTHQGSDFLEESLDAAGIRAIELYPEPKQKDKYGQVIGEAVMSNGNRYPLQIVQVESKLLNL